MNTGDWSHAVLDALAHSGEEGQAVANFIAGRKVKIRFHQQSSGTAGRWTLCGNIEINPGCYSTQTRPDDAALLSLIVHEARHLRQGLLRALSVYGELEAWQAGYNIYKLLMGVYPHPILAEICALSLGWDRHVLRQARTLMQKYATKGYRIDLLPLYPIVQEIFFRLTGRVP